MESQSCICPFHERTVCRDYQFVGYLPSSPHSYVRLNTVENGSDHGAAGPLENPASPHRCCGRRNCPFINRRRPILEECSDSCSRLASCRVVEEDRGLPETHNSAAGRNFSALVSAEGSGFNDCRVNRDCRWVPV
jgi:hypothetical protein